MALYKPTELLSFLNSMGIKPKKGLSQNFLIDGNIVRKILDAGDLHENEQVLEIGPGPGVLTEALLAKKCFVVAIEADLALANALKRLDQDAKYLKVIHQDALKTPLDEIRSHFPDPSKRIKVFGNLPYHITTPLIDRFIREVDWIESITIMIQYEVAKRMVASPKTADYSSLTLFLQYFSTVKYQFKVNKNCFFPVPKVDSAVVTLLLKPAPHNIDEETFFKILRSAFKQRRKALRVSLANIYPKELIEECLSHLGLNSLARPEELSFESWIKIYRFLTNKK